MSGTIDIALSRRLQFAPADLAGVGVLNVTAHLDPAFGGICAVVPSLCSAVRLRTGARVGLAAFCEPGETFPSIAGVPSRRYPLGGREWLRHASARHNLSDQIRGADLVHIHGLWREHCTGSAWLARRWRKPYIVSAHGMLQTWALADKKLKKAVFSFVFERRNLARASCLHALTRAEVAEYRAFGIKAPVAIVPNGVDVPAVVSPEPFLNAFPQLRGRRLILYLGRIHYKKGVDLLCRAWAAMAGNWPDAHLVIAGPDFDNTRAGIERLVQERGIGQRVTFTGMLHGELKWSALEAAEFFMLPSHSEGLSVSVLEAMGRGLPVVVSEECNLPEVREHRCGLTIQPLEGQIREAMATLLSMHTAELKNLGNKGRQLIRQRYSWETVAAQMGEVYQWILTGRLPANVEVSQAA